MLFKGGRPALFLARVPFFLPVCFIKVSEKKKTSGWSRTLFLTVWRQGFLEKQTQYQGLTVRKGWNSAWFAEKTRMNGYSNRSMISILSHLPCCGLIWPTHSQTHPNQAENMAQPGLFANKSMTISAIRSAMMGSPSSPYSRITQANSWKDETCMVGSAWRSISPSLPSSLVHSCNHCHAGIPTCWFIRRSKSASCHG